MYAFLARRLLATIPVLLIVAVLVFLMLRLTPGDPAAILAGDAANTEQIARIRDEPRARPADPRCSSASGSATCCAAISANRSSTRQKVTTLIGQRLEPTLALATLTIAVRGRWSSVPLGVLAAWRHGGWFDRALMGFSVLGFSVPVFVLGYLLICLVSLKLGWLPVQGYQRIARRLLAVPAAPDPARRSRCR